MLEVRRDLRRLRPFNLTILECKYLHRTQWELGGGTFNLTILECKLQPFVVILAILVKLLI